MLRLVLVTALSLLSFSVRSQSVTIALQSFETDGDTWEPLVFSTPPCSMDGDSWDYQTSLGSIGPSHGLQFWGITDLYGSCGSQGFESIRFPDIDISGYREVVCSFDVQVEGYDNGDDMSYICYLDGTPGEEVLFIDGGDDLSTGGWRQVTIEVPNAAQSFGLEIRVKQNGSDVGGIDQVRLSGKPFIPCEELLISEYIEGTSSATHRNNYLEVYNPTSDTLALESYDLAK